MTPKQKRVLDFIAKFIGECGISPTMQEIADEVGFCNKSGAHLIVQRLKRDGHVVSDGRRPRSMRLAEPTDDPNRIAFVQAAKTYVMARRAGVDAEPAFSAMDAAYSRIEEGGHDV